MGTARNQLQPEDHLWVAILEREPSLKTLGEREVREALAERDFPGHVIDAFLASRRGQLKAASR